MRIIELGNYELTFICQHCKSVLGVNTDELFRSDEDNCWSYTCPVCMKTNKVFDDKFIEYMQRREDFKKELWGNGLSYSQHATNNQGKEK